MYNTYDSISAGFQENVANSVSESSTIGETASVDNFPAESTLSALAAESIPAGKKRLRKRKRVIAVIPVKEYTPKEVQQIRNSTGLSQSMFASYMGVSIKTVEAWEMGINRPSGVASRILSMMEMDGELTRKFPFVQAE